MKQKKHSIGEIIRILRQADGDSSRVDLPGAQYI